MAAPKMTKNQMRRAKKKEEKKAKAEAATQPELAKAEDETSDVAVTAAEKTEATNGAPDASAASTETRADAPIKTEEEPADALADYDDPAFAQFKDVFDKFGGGPGALLINGEDVAHDGKPGGNRGGEVFTNDDFDAIPDEEDAAARAKLSKKKRKKLNTLSIAELKALVKTPEVVEWNDVSSSDPRLLVIIKAQKNIVPVPAHWSLKREYLSSKRGVEKPPFQLPAFIAETGITEMRDAVLEKQAEQTLKQKQRERVAPKMGKLDIDYQRLYDAFFRFQTKPSLTRFGDVYYEGKEWETEFRSFKPGDLTDTLKEALNMPPGFPPPWMLQQQRIGPPPSYPNIKIPGLNAPLPQGASWGFAPGQWGKPPVDEYNRPLYGGDVFGIQQPGANGAEAGTEAAAQPALGEPVERAIWGELQPPEEESEEEESEEEDDEEEEDEEEGGADMRPPGGLDTPSGFASSVPTDYPAAPLGVGSGAGEMDLRKQRRGGYETEESAFGGGPPRSAYTVIPERQAQSQGFFGSERTYDLSKSGGGAGGAPVLGQEDANSHKRKKPGDVDVALDPDALQSHDGISKAELERQFEERRRTEGVGAQWQKSQYDDDLSEMIAQESRKRQKRDEDRRGGDKKKETKYRF